MQTTGAGMQDEDEPAAAARERGAKRSSEWRGHPEGLVLKLASDFLLLDP